MSDRKRVWCNIIYPESMPENIWDILSGLKIPVAVSPLHNPDEETTKQHYHVVYKFSGKKTSDSVQFIRELTKGTYLQPVNDIRAYVRYLIHLDNPEKQQFDSDPGKIKRFCGFPFGTIFEMDSFDAEEHLSGLFDYIKQNGIIEYAELIDRLVDDGELQYFNLATKKYALSVTRYLTSRRNLAGLAYKGD